jgi:hypothetical protein
MINNDKESCQCLAPAFSCARYSAVSQWKNCLKKRKLRRTITNLSGRRSTALVSDERIKGVSLTGSEAAVLVWPKLQVNI